MKIKRPYFDLNYPSKDNKKENRIASILNNKNKKSFTETIFLEKEKLKKEIIKKEQETRNNFEEKEKKINFLRKPVIVFQNDDIINNLNNENYDLFSYSEEPTIYNFSDSNDESGKINYLEFKISDKTTARNSLGSKLALILLFSNSRKSDIMIKITANKFTIKRYKCLILSSVFL